MDRKQFRDLAAPDRAREVIASLDLAPEAETVPLRKARGRVLAERIDADLDVTGFDRASVDGYALKAADTFGADESDPAELSCVGTVHAGVEPDVDLDTGECAEISTGAVVPPGADAVVMVEQTDREEEQSADTVLVRTSLAPGDNVMFAGADIAAGERALGPGTVITSREIGLLSAIGADSIPVRGKATVGIVSTGDELVRPGDALDSATGQIYDVNSYTTATAVEETGGEVRLYPHTNDDYDAMESALRTAAEECDLVLSSGSTSASAVDVIYRVVEETGELLLHGVAVKPGKPMLVGRIGTSETDQAPPEDTHDEQTAGSAYIGLPGYPVSALTIFRTFVAPAIRRAAGRPEPETATVDAKMAVRERYSQGRLRYMPTGLVTDGDGETLAYPVDKGSGATTSLVEADGVVAVPPDVEYLDAGESVEVQLFSSEVRPPTLFGAGEDDPALSRLLDRIDRPRYLAVGSRQGRRRLRDGVTDFAVATGASLPSGTELGSWRREWGLIVPAGNPDTVEGVEDLVDADLQFINRTSDSGLRSTLVEALDGLAAERGVERRELTDEIDGFDLAVRAHESPARKVLADDADVGLGLRATAESLDMEFVSCGNERVTVVADEDRLGKLGVDALEAAIEDGDSVFESLPGYQC